MNEYEIGKDYQELKIKIDTLNQILIEITKLLDYNISNNKLEQPK